MKQTAVEWFAKELNNWRIKEFGEYAIIGIPTEVINQAKAMEKEQIVDAFSEGTRIIDVNDEMSAMFNGIIYYDETYEQR
jgi:hypothetical protein